MIRALALALACVGCRDLSKANKTDTAACAGDTMASVLVHVVDASQEPLVPDRVEWTVDGSAWRPAECLAQPCTDWAAGWEIVGEVTVIAYLTGQDTGCELSAQDTVSVVLPEGECHVDQQELTLVLDPSACG